MGAPTKYPQKASAGRLNSAGIPYLYLSEREIVALKEIKAAVNDVCTIATFITTSELNVVDLSRIADISIFSFENKSTYLLNYQILQDIDQAMKNTSGKFRSEVVYAPTEYMSDLIKSMNVDGIIYNSSLDKNTKDVVLFKDYDDQDSKIEQIRSEIKTIIIKKIDYQIVKYAS